MSDYEVRNANAWKITEQGVPTRRDKKGKKQKNKKNKKKSDAGSVAGSATGSVKGSRPASPARSVSSNTNMTRPVSRAQSTKGSGPPPSSSSEPNILSPPPSEYEPSPWVDEPRYTELYDSDIQAGGFFEGYESQQDSDEVYRFGAFISPNFYYNDDPALEMEAYEGPDGLRRENEGVRLERSGYAPNASFTVRARRSAKFDERFFGPHGVNLRHIAGKTNTFIDIPEDPDEPDIPVWGKPDHVSIAIRELMMLTEHIQREMEFSKKRRGRDWEGWKKIRAAPSDRMQKYLEEKARERAKRRDLRHPPPNHPFEFNAVGVFVWPKETNPQDYLGTSFDRLDDIRYDCNVYIDISRPSAGCMFQVLGEDQNSVQKAVDRLYGTYCEAAAKNRKITEKFLVHPPSMCLQNISVNLIKDRELNDRQTQLHKGVEGVRANLVGEYPSWDFLQDWKVRRQKLERANHSYIRKAMEQGLKDVLYHKGHASLKIHFGAFLFFGYRLPQPGEDFSLEEFGSIVRDPIGRTAGEVIRYIGEDHVAKALINECLARKDLFDPVESGYSKFSGNPYSDVPHEHDEYTDPDLSIPEPTISATFELKIYDHKGQPRDVRLEVQFERIPGRHPGDIANEGGDLYKVGMRRWLYLHTCTKGLAQQRRKGPFDIRVLDLENDLAWQFELNTYQLCSETDEYRIFSEFVRRIRIEDIPDESDRIGPPTSGVDCRKRVQRISYVNLPGIVVEKLVQKTKYQFWITKTSYMFEITRYECFSTEEVDGIYPVGVRISWKGVETNHDIRWGAALTNVDWDETLAKQTSIGIGCTGEWEPDIDSFFKSSAIGGFDHPAWARVGNVLENPDPWEEDGWKELMTRVDEITRFIGGVKRANVAFAEPGHAGPEEFDE